MKRFLRYVLYRELYRSLRNLTSESADKPADTSSGQSPSTQGSTTAQSSTEQPAEIDLPDGLVDGSPIESTAQLTAVLQRMDPYEFEHFVADLWERMGWETTVSTASADKGVDVTAKKSTPYEQQVLIQAKRYGPNTTVGSPDIQQYASLRHQYSGVDKVIIVTTNEFTQQAREMATRLNVKCITGDELSQLIVDHDATDLVATYLDWIDVVDTADEAGKQSDKTGDKPADAPESEGAVGPTNAGEPADAVETGKTETAAATNQTGTAASTAVESTAWHKLSIAGVLGWPVLFFSVLVLSETVWFLFFFTVWIGLPVALALDARTVRKKTDWPTYWWAYVLGALVWFLAVIPAGIYLWRRRSAGA